MKKEIWKPVKDYEGLYEVSNYGNVKSLNRVETVGKLIRIRKERILKPCVNSKGYLQVGLCKNGKITNKLIHRLVAEAFIPNTDNLQQVNHKGENKQNNCVWQLEWCTNKYNSNYGTRNERIRKRNTNGKLSKPVSQYTLDGNYIKEFSSTMEVQRQLGYAQANISLCCNGKYKHAYGYKWKYNI